jgi:putative DNA primase/helicase
MATKKLLPHSPDYGFTWQLPRPYSAIESSWKNIDRFLDSLCVGNQQLKELAIAYCNAVLVGRSDLHKFLYLFGSGRNGKGVFSKLLSMLIGKENTHSTTMIELNGNRFEPANLRGKRLVLMSDEDKYTGGIGILKSASGGDPLRHEDKGKKAGSFYFRGMIVISANSPTFVGSGGFALFSRKIDFPCLAKIAENDRRDISPELEPTDGESFLPRFPPFLKASERLFPSVQPEQFSYPLPSTKPRSSEYRRSSHNQGHQSESSPVASLPSPPPAVVRARG